MTDRRTIRRNARSNLCLALHNGYRKALDGGVSTPMWNFIHVCPGHTWADVGTFVDAFLPLDRGKAFTWQTLRGAMLCWCESVRGSNRLVDRYAARVLIYLIEQHTEDDWKKLADWLGGSAR